MVGFDVLGFRAGGLESGVPEFEGARFGMGRLGSEVREGKFESIRGVLSV